MRKLFILIGFLFSIMVTSSVYASEPNGIHKVQEVDTLFGIALRYKLPLKEVMEINQLKSKDLQVEQYLHITKTKQLKGKKIVVDPGHGGAETGAISHGIVEKEAALAVAQKVKRQLEAEGAQVVLTVDEHFQEFRMLPLAERASIAKRVDGDLFISIHFNSNPYRYVHGTETYYNKSEYKKAKNPYPKESEKLAKSIQQHLVNEIKTQDLGIKENVFHVLRNNTVPSALVEVGFLTNKEEASKIKTEAFKEDTALGITKGIIHYFD